MNKINPSGYKSNKIILSAPLTHSDWVIKDNIPGLDDRLSGVRYMLDECKSAGLSKIYWRMLDAGRSLYPSDFLDPMGVPDDIEDCCFNPTKEEEDAIGIKKNFDVLNIMKERYHYCEIDSVAEAVKYGHEIGLEIHAWFSINEDDHGWGWPSRFSKEHPNYRWKRRNGQFYHSQISFAYPEAQDYKLSIIKEVLDNYDVDGVFLDWIRTGDVRDPQVDTEGVSDYGYEDILVNGFIKQYDLDPHNLPNNDMRWVQYRAEPQTEFMRNVRKLIKFEKPNLPIAVMVQHPWSYRGINPKYADNLSGLLLDVATWANEELMDSIVGAGYYFENSGGTPAKVYNYLKSLTNGNTDIWVYYNFMNTIEKFKANFYEAEKLGTKQILFWEADYIDNVFSNKKELKNTMLKYGGKF